MRRNYERPLVMVEEFAPNHAIAACNANVDVTFDCMDGSQTDTANVLSDTLGITGCRVQAGYTAGITTAKTSTSRFGHSSYNNNLSWRGRIPNLTATAVTEGCQGFLYICAEKKSGNTSASDFNTDGWSVSGTTISHSSHSDCYHVMVAPVYGSVSTGS